MPAEQGMEVRGTIVRISSFAIPSKIRGGQSKPVSRVTLDITAAIDPHGNPVNQSLLLGPFEGPPDLATRFEAGQTVVLRTTTPTGLHISSMSLVN